MCCGAHASMQRCSACAGVTTQLQLTNNGQRSQQEVDAMVAEAAGAAEEDTRFKRLSEMRRKCDDLIYEIEQQPGWSQHEWVSSNPHLHTMSRQMPGPCSIHCTAVCCMWTQHLEQACLIIRTWPWGACCLAAAWLGSDLALHLNKAMMQGCFCAGVKASAIINGGRGKHGPFTAYHGPPTALAQAAGWLNCPSTVTVSCICCQLHVCGPSAHSAMPPNSNDSASAQ